MKRKMVALEQSASASKDVLMIAGRLLVLVTVHS